MPGDRQQIEEIKERLNIEDIVKRYVKLKPAGKNLFGLCPFHKEDTPSFSVNSELGIYKCFGCGEAGDVFSFIQKIENLDFAETLEMLAKEAGVTLKKTSPAQRQIADISARINEDAQKFFHHILLKHKLGEQGRKYLSERNISEAAVSEFRIGYAPMSPDNSLASYLQKKEYSPENIVSFGFAKKIGARLKDKFLGRLMFPIISKSGKCLGFSGRAVVDTDNRPKYLNTPETPVFHKGDLLFGIYQAKSHIRNADSAILVEGQIDVISSWQINVKNIVAPLGTGTTLRQLRLISSFTKNVALAFDNDPAGQNAAFRVSQLCYQEGLSPTIIRVPEGKDVDECIQKSAESWQKASKTGIPAASYFLTTFAENRDLGQLSVQKAVIRQVFTLISTIRDETSKEFHLKEVAELFDIPIDSLRKQLVSKPISYLKPEDEVALASKDYTDETFLVANLVQNPSIAAWAIEKINTEHLQDSRLSKVVDALKKANLAHEFSIKKFLATFSDSDSDFVQSLALWNFWPTQPSESKLKHEIQKIITKLKLTSAKREIEALRRDLFLAEKKQETDKANFLLNQIHAKIKELKALEDSNQS